MRTHSICDPIRLIIFEHGDMQIYGHGVAYPVLTRYQLGVCSVLVIRIYFIWLKSHKTTFSPRKILILVTCFE
jgi:hypothetical protein